MTAIFIGSACDSVRRPLDRFAVTESCPSKPKRALDSRKAAARASGCRNYRPVGRKPMIAWRNIGQTAEFEIPGSIIDLTNGSQFLRRAAESSLELIQAVAEFDTAAEM